MSPHFRTGTKPPTLRSLRLLMQKAGSSSAKIQISATRIWRVAIRPTLIIGVGNTSNNDLITLLDARLEQIVTALSNTTLVELRRGMLILHPARQE
jgi:hypothetical protein